MTEDPPLHLASLALSEFLPNPLRGRWIAAISLLALASSLFLMDALYALVDRSARFAVAPAPFQWDNAAKAGVASSREDRLTLQTSKTSGPDRQVRVEQLRASGLEMRPFTHVVALLATIDAASLVPKRAQPAAAPSVALPPEILAGQSRSKLASDVSAYAPAAIEPAALTSEPPPLGEPINVTRVSESAPHASPTRRVIVAKPGDSFAMIMRALGAPQDQAQSLQTLYAGQGGGAFSGGEKISVLEGGDAPVAAPVQVRVEREGAQPWEAALADDGRYALRRPESPSVPSAPTQASSADLRQSVDESVRDSLNGLVGAESVDPSLVDEMTRLCGHDFDLDAPVGPKDRVEFLYSTAPAAEPELRFIELTEGGKTREYYRFTAPDDGSVDYYDRDGRSVTKFLLRKPAPAGKLGDAFGWRIHPILKDRRFHEGVDYDAPMGSPIEAAGAGVVEKISEESGYGKYMRVRHDLGYETTYAHVAGFARGLKVGSRVRQGEVIAYVGSTGLSTGPHLYYEIRINGRNVDPLKIRLADGRVLAGGTLADFEARRKETDELVKASPTSQSIGMH